MPHHDKILHLAAAQLSEINQNRVCSQGVVGFTTQRTRSSPVGGYGGCGGQDRQESKNRQRRQRDRGVEGRRKRRGQGGEAHKHPTGH